MSQQLELLSGDSLRVEQGFPNQGGGSTPTSSLQLRKSQWWVATIPLSVAQAFIAEHHYARGGSNTATYRHGLFRRDALNICLGVAWWIPPTKSAALATYPENWRAVLSLSRLAIHPSVPKNAATFLLMRSVREIAKDSRWDCLVTYADEWRGHTGTIYKAAGWEYKGKTKPERTYVDDNGRMVARKAGPRTRRDSEMKELGYKMVGAYSKHKFVFYLSTLRKPDSTL